MITACESDTDRFSVENFAGNERPLSSSTTDLPQLYGSSPGFMTSRGGPTSLTIAKVFPGAARTTSAKGCTSLLYSTAFTCNWTSSRLQLRSEMQTGRGPVACE